MKTTNDIKNIKNQVEENIKKYGLKDDDVISRAYRDAQHNGDCWCAYNVKRYLSRFIGTSRKSHNLVDLLKAKDYLNRMIKANQHLKKKEIIE